MFKDARRIASGECLSCDICIVGAGAAGITLAMELAVTGKQIITVEAGSRHRSGKSQRLYRGTISDPARHLPPDCDRYRQLGGTTALWGGRCIPFDPIDFDNRSYVPFSGWPWSYAELEPYYQRAHVYCDCGPFVYRSEYTLLDAPRQMIAGFEVDEITTNTLERWSPPVRFGKSFGDKLSKASNISVLLNAVCVEVHVSHDGGNASALDIRTFAGNTFRIQPRVTVLSGGGLEVTRLLLASNRVHGEGLGNHADWLGRGYMCHLTGTIARAKMARDSKVVFGYEIDRAGVYCRRRLCVSEDAQRKHGVLNTNFLLDRPLIEDPDHKSGMMSLAFVAKQLFQRHENSVPAMGKYSLYFRHLRNILSGSPEILSVLPSWFRGRFVDSRRLPSLLTRPNTNAYYLLYQTEQRPDRESRITLTRERDELGMPRLFVDFRVAEDDIHSIRRAHLLLDRALRDSGVGMLDFGSADLAEKIQRNRAVLGHHIGTTRMSADPNRGVVDENCRVHGLSNLYVASSAVFPTSSQANPTLTIVALAIRLADHLRASIL